MKQPIREFKIYKRRLRCASVVLPLCEHKKGQNLNDAQGLARRLKTSNAKCERDKQNERKADRREKQKQPSECAKSGSKANHAIGI